MLGKCYTTELYPQPRVRYFKGSYTGLSVLKQLPDHSPLYMPVDTWLEAALNGLGCPDPPYLMQA